MICGRDRAKLGAFWRPSFQIARCGNHNGSVVNPDSGRPIVLHDERLLKDDFDKQARFAEMLEGIALCGGEKTKPRRLLYSALWQVDGSRLRRYAPIEFIGRYMPNFFKFGIADEVHEAKAADTAQGNALGTLAAAVGQEHSPHRDTYRRHGVRCVQRPVSDRSQADDLPRLRIRRDRHPELHGNVRGAGDNHHHRAPGECMLQSEGHQARKERPGASPLLFARFLMDIGTFVSLEDISANLPPYMEEVVSVPMDKPLAAAYVKQKRTLRRPFRSTVGIRR